MPIIISALRATSFELVEIPEGAVTWLCPLPTCAMRLCRRSNMAPRNRAGPVQLIADAFLALTSDPAEMQQGVDEFLPVYPRLTNYPEMFAAAGYPEARQGTWSAGMVDAVVLHGTDDQCRKKLESFIRTSGCRRSSCPSCSSAPIAMPPCDEPCKWSVR